MFGGEEGAARNAEEEMRFCQENQSPVHAVCGATTCSYVSGEVHSTQEYKLVSRDCCSAVCSDKFYEALCVVNVQTCRLASSRASSSCRFRVLHSRDFSSKRTWLLRIVSSRFAIICRRSPFRALASSNFLFTSTIGSKTFVFIAGM